MSPVFRHGRLRLYLLKLLDEAPRHGYEVIRLLQDRFLGVYAPSPGTIYPRLARLEEEGLVTHDEVDGKKVYRITGKGRAELNARLDELADLEEEITASVRDIAREVSEDVRATVRSLREEMTSAAREMRGQGRDSRTWREQFREDTQAAREQARQAAGAAREHARSAREQARQEAQAAREQARQEGQAAREQARAAHDRRKNEWEQATGEKAQDTGRERERGDERARSGEHGWGDWSEWPGWLGRGGHGWADPGAYRDLDKVARQFAREFRRAAEQAQVISEEAAASLHDILEDALTRIKAEVFSSGPGHAARPGSGPSPEPGANPEPGAAPGPDPSPESGSGPGPATP
jgi:DNA-binding PadR family transcriptional regulator